MGVKLYADKGRLRLEWFFQSRKYYLYLGMEDTKSNRRKIASSQLLLELEADLENGEVDTSLIKYKAFIKGESPKKITVSELYEKWITEKAKGLTKKTAKKYEGSFKEVSCFFPSLPVDALTLNHCRGFWEWIQEKPAKPATYNRKLARLQACWDWGQRQELIKSSENLWRKIDKILLKANPEPRPFSTEEILLILRGFQESCHELTLFVEFLLRTGTRIGEACGLRWSDLSADCKTIHISSQLTEGERKPTKTGKSRSFDLPKSISTQLNNIKQETKPDPTALIFTQKGRVIEIRGFRRRIWKPILEKMGVEYRKPYNCRHTFISHALQRGLNPVVIANITGHDVQTLFSYYAGLISQPEAPELF